MTDENEEVGQVETPAQEVQAEEVVNQTPDYSKNFDELKSLNQKLAEDNASLKRDIQAHKEELVKYRDENRRDRLILAGDKDVIRQEEEKSKAERIKNEFYNIFPNAKDLLEKAPATDGQKQYSVGEMAFFNSSRDKAFEMAVKQGFETNEGKQMLTVLGDILINQYAPWKERYYSQGDQKVIEEVGKWLEEKIFAPRDKIIENRLLEKIRKQGRFAAPVPQRSGSSSSPIPQKKEKFDYNNPNQRLQGLTALAERIMGNAE